MDIVWLLNRPVSLNISPLPHLFTYIDMYIYTEFGEEMAYGKELIIDLYGCNVKLFTRKHISIFMKELCEFINMEREDLHFWDYDGVPEEEITTEPHLRGRSAVQFITTSNIVIHTLDLVAECYINIFTCKDFHEYNTTRFTQDFFEARRICSTTVKRGVYTHCNGG